METQHDLHNLNTSVLLRHSTRFRLMITITALLLCGFSAQSAKLPVPYYSQSNNSWCWAASTAMLTKYYCGENFPQMKPSIIAAMNGAAPTTGDLFLTKTMNSLALIDPDHTYVCNITELYIGSYFRPHARDYLIAQIDVGNPVLVWWYPDALALEPQGHVFIVTGYEGTDVDNGHVYINDPSGAFTANASYPCINVEMTWNQFFDRINDWIPVGNNGVLVHADNAGVGAGTTMSMDLGKGAANTMYQPNCVVIEWDGALHNGYYWNADNGSPGPTRAIVSGYETTGYALWFNDQLAIGPDIWNFTASDRIGRVYACIVKNGAIVLEGSKEFTVASCGAESPYIYFNLWEILPSNEGEYFLRLDLYDTSGVEDVLMDTVQSPMYIENRGDPLIVGTVRDGQGNPIKNAVVSADGTDGDTPFSLTDDTDSSGEFAILLPRGCNVSISAEKSGYNLPTAYIHLNLMTSTRHDFAAVSEILTISGHVQTSGGSDISGTIVSADNEGGSDITDSNGDYELTVPYDWSGTITATQTGYTFPSNWVCDHITTDHAGLDFTGVPIVSPTISGHVYFSGGGGIGGATVSANNDGGSVTTDSSGYYELTVPYGWGGIVTVSKTGFTFSTIRGYECVTTDQSGADFTGLDIVSPGNVTGFTAVPGDTIARLTWSNPSDSDLVGIKIMRKIGSYPTDENDGTTAYTGLNTEFIDSGLNNGTEYYYKAFSFDISDNYASGSSANATPYEILTYYVSPAGSHTWPYANWNTAANDFQTAIDIADPDDTILAGDGIYSVTSQICVDKNVSVKSLNGPDFSIVEGCKGVTGFVFSESGALDGFTIQHFDSEVNGAAISLTSDAENVSVVNCKVSDNTALIGAGCLSFSSNATISISNCTFNGNQTTGAGGAAIFIFDGDATRIQNCSIINNVAMGDFGRGGGVRVQTGEPILENCIISCNSAYYGGGIFCTPTATIKLYNCTLYENTFEEPSSPYIVASSLFMYNSIWFSERPPAVSKSWEENIFSSCIWSWDCPFPENGNISDWPGFVDEYAGSFHLDGSSPCINWGNNSFAISQTDLAGNLRVVGSSIDMGAYEYEIDLGLDCDDDGISDKWERDQFNRNIDPDAISSNGINTIRQIYIAGLDPNDPRSRFQVSAFNHQPFGNVLWWNATSGRVYSVYWTSNLLSGFQCLESNVPWSQGCFTNLATNSCGYYKIGVRLEE